MCIMQVIERVFNFLISISPLIQAIFAVVVGFYIVKQTGIFRQQAEISAEQAKIMVRQTEVMDKQAEIMSRQNQIAQEVEKSGRIATMRSKYASLWDTRKTFWDKTDTFYNTYKVHRQLERSLDSLISGEGFPYDFDPAKVKSLRQSVKDHEGDWKRWNPHLWEFARFVYPNDQDVDEDNDLFERQHTRNKQHLDTLHRVRSELAYFWDDWASELDIRRYRPPELAEVIMLTWLELACVRRYVGDRSHGPGKKDLFRVAKEEWEEFGKPRGD